MTDLPTDADDIAYLLAAPREQLVEAIILLHERVPRNVLTIARYLRRKYYPNPNLYVVRE